MLDLIQALKQQVFGGSLIEFIIMQHIFEKLRRTLLSILTLGSRRYLNKGVLQSSKSALTSLEVTSGRFGSFSGELTGLVTGESAESTGAIGLADLEVSAWPTRVVGLADWASAKRGSA